MEREQQVELHFPLAGIDQQNAFEKQMPRQLPNGEYAKTCVSGTNVRAFQGQGDRASGGARAGVAKYLDAAIVEDWIIQELSLLVTKGIENPGSGTVQQSQAGRVVTLVAVSQGDVYTARPGDTEWTQATNGTGFSPPLNYTGILYSTQLNQRLWFADGVNYVYYDPSVDTVFRWLPSVGVLPVDFRGNTPRLICTWRGRLVVAGLLYDSHNWFMSAVGDPTNWDYAPFEQSATQAVAGNNSPMGLVGDVINTLIPYTDDVLIFGGDHTLYLCSGDPVAGGQIDLVSSSIGTAFGIPWCQDHYGNIYFVSNRMGIYTFVPGQQPVRISQQIEQLLQAINTGETTIRLMWNDRFQGLHVFMSPTRAPAETTHFFWEQRTGAWWQDQFTDTDMDPLTCCVFDGNEPDDRVALIGSWDGYVRSFSSPAEDDDGVPIESEVLIGPLTSKNMDDILLKDVQAILGKDSGEVTYKILVGATAELALDSDPVATGTWKAGRNLLNLVRRSGHAVYIQLSSTNAWAMEVIRARLVGKGKVRARGR